MIKIIEGDLLKATEDIIGHQVNCYKIGSGVALAIKNKWKAVYKSHNNICKNVSNKELLLGLCQIVKVEENKWVANLFGQLNYGYDGKKYTQENKLKLALEDLKLKAMKFNKSIALPYKIGSDRGGADWDEVYKMIDEVFSDYEVTLYRLKK